MGQQHAVAFLLAGWDGTFHARACCADPAAECQSGTAARSRPREGYIAILLYFCVGDRTGTRCFARVNARPWQDRCGCLPGWFTWNDLACDRFGKCGDA